jgi:UDP-glucose 4-epimerase
MPPRVVLVTAVSRPLGARLAEELARDRGVGRVLGVDVVPPSPQVARSLGRTEFVRTDIRNPTMAKVLAAAEVDTVVHLNVVATPGEAGSRAAMKEINVIGTMQLLAACQKVSSVQKLVVRSTAAVYGSSPHDPAVFTEDMEPGHLPRSGYAKDAVEIEGYVRGFSRRRPDVAITMLRFTSILGPRIDGPLASYFALPVVPTVLGFDPRLQLLHEDDAHEVLCRAALGEHPGTFNVAGRGVLLLSQAIRRAGRLPMPVLPPAVHIAGGLVRRAGLLDFSPEQLRFLIHGRVVDVTALHERFGYVPAYSTAETLDDFVAAQLAPALVPEALHRVEQAAAALLGRGNAAHA